VHIVAVLAGAKGYIIGITNGSGFASCGKPSRRFLWRFFLMSIALWLPVLFVLGVVTIGLMLAFIVACERV
jgi:hypothetical protein